jgi:hypothetical protein
VTSLPSTHYPFFKIFFQNLADIREQVHPSLLFSFPVQQILDDAMDDYQKIESCNTGR